MAFDFDKFPELSNTQMQFYYWDSPHKQINESFDAKVVRVIDGDTIQVKTDFRDFEFPVRFANVNAPELNNEGGKEAKSWLEGELADEEIRVIVNPQNRVGKFGRILGEVIRAGININEASLVAGHSRSI